MADFDKIKINGVPYNVKDTATAQTVAQVASNLAKTNATVQQQGQTIAQQGQQITQQGEQIAQQGAQIEQLENKPDLESIKIITPQMVGAKGDGVTDDTSAFQAAIEAAYHQGATLYIPATGNLDTAQGYKGYILSKTLNITKPMTIIADPLSVLNWANMTSEPTLSGTDPTTNAKLYSTGIGINIDYGTYRNHKGTYQFGILQGCMNYRYPGASLPSGHYGYGVRIANGDLVRFYAKYVSYWKRGIMIEADIDFTANETVEWDVMDDCQEGLVLQSQGSAIIEGVNVRFNTIGLCKYGIMFTRQNTGPINPVIHGVTIEGAEIWTEYTDGACIYSQTEAGVVQNLKISIGECYNICNPETSKEGISAAEYGPIVSGTGNGCFKAYNAELEIGVMISDNSQLAVNGAVGLDGQITFHNRVQQFANTYDTAYDVVSSASASFNGGQIPVGNDMFVRITLPANVTAGQTLTYYVKKQGVPSGGQAAPRICPLSAYPATMAITNTSDYTNYQVLQISVHALENMNSYTLYAIVGT